MDDIAHPIVERAQPQSLPPGQAFNICESHKIPMIYTEDGEWICAVDSLWECLEEAELVDFAFMPIPDGDETEITLSLVFDDGHVVPLLCPDCGNALDDDEEEIAALREQIKNLSDRRLSDVLISEDDRSPYPWLSTLLTLEVGGVAIEADFPLLSLYYMTHPEDDEEVEDEYEWDNLN